MEVFNGQQGVGPGIGGVSTEVTSTQPIVAERPIYMVHDFGGGLVSGAHDGMGQTGLGKLFGFAAASSEAAENDFLTIQNPNALVANLTITYYPGGTPVTRTLSVDAHTRHTVEVFNMAEGVGPGISTLGITIASDQPVLVEKPTYSATDTAGYASSTF